MNQLQDLRLQAYCPKCKRTSWIEVSVDELDINPSISNGIPIPNNPKNKNTGLFRRSLSHGDHILLLEIDLNGTVRKEHVVSLISSMVENIVAQTVEKILRSTDNPENGKQTLIYLSHAKPFRNFFRSILSILMLNIEDKIIFTSKVEEEAIVFTYNNLSIIQGQVERIREEYKGIKINCLTVDLGSLDEKYIISVLKDFSITNANIVITYNSKILGRTPTLLLNYLIGKGYSNISLFDYATGQGLSNIIEKSFESVV